MAPYAPAPTAPLDFGMSKKKLITSISSASKNDIASAPKKKLVDPVAPIKQAINPLGSIGQVMNQSVSPMISQQPSQPETKPMVDFMANTEAPKPQERSMWEVSQANAGEDLFNTYMKDPAISDSGKKSLKSDLDSGKVTTEQADAIIAQIYKEKQDEPVKEPAFFQDAHPTESTIGQAIKAPFRSIGNVIGGIGSGIEQAAYGGLNASSDLITSGINKVLGTNLPAPVANRETLMTGETKAPMPSIGKSFTDVPAGISTSVFNSAKAPLAIGIQTASELPGSQYLMQAIGKGLDIGADELASATGIDKETAQNTITTIMNTLGIKSKGIGTLESLKKAGNASSFPGAVGSIASDIGSATVKTIGDVIKMPYEVAKSTVNVAKNVGNKVGGAFLVSQEGVPEGSFRNAMGDTVKKPMGGATGKGGFVKVPGRGYTENGDMIDLPQQGNIGKIKSKVLDTPVEKLEVPNALGETPLSRMASRAVMPTSGTKSGPDLLKNITSPEIGLKKVWELQRTGKVEGNLDSMPDTAKVIIDGLDKYGKEIGEIRQRVANDTLNTTDIAQIGEKAVNSKLRNIQGEAGFPRLKQFYEDLISDMPFDQVFETKRNIGNEIGKLRKSGDAGTSTYKALSDMNDGLAKKIDSYLENDTGLSGSELAKYKEAMKTYGTLKGISQDFLKSTVVDSRRSPMSIAEQMSMIQGGYFDLITSPIREGAKLVGREFAKEIASRNTREGAMKQFFDSMDRIAQERIPQEIAPITEQPVSTPPTIGDAFNKK